MEFFSVEQIAEKRGVTKQAIYKQIRVHSKELEGHTNKVNGRTWYDEEAVKILDDASSQSPAVFVETQEKVEAEREIAQLKEEIAELKEKLEVKERVIEQTAVAMAEVVKKADENATLIAESKLYLEQKERVQDKCDHLEAEIKRAEERHQEELARMMANPRELFPKAFEMLEKEKEALQKEVASYRKTAFGLYRKDK